MPSFATEFTTRRYKTPLMPHARRKYVQSRQWEADYFDAIIPGVVFITAENLPRCHMKSWYTEGNQHKADCSPKHDVLEGI